MAALVEVKKFSYAWPGASGWILRRLDLEVHTGECCCLTGPTGSGKSTLALALKDMLPVGRQEGEIIFTSPTLKVGLVLQNPETQLFASTLGEEVAFALENQGLEPALMPALVAEALAAVGLDQDLDTPVANLSMGQKYRVLLASVLVMQPQLLILDEPAAQLDDRGLKELRQVLAILAGRGTAVLLCEHRPEVFAGLIDRHWVLADGALLHDHPAAISAQVKIDQPASLRFQPLTQATEVVLFDDVTVAQQGIQPLWSHASFVIEAGQRVLIQGANGAGKTTLLRLMAGLAKPFEGRVKVMGQQPEPGRLNGQLSLMWQNPQRQLFEDRVIDEVGFSLRRSGLSATERGERAMAILQKCGIADLGEQSPHKLSYGQKQLVVLASVLAGHPRLLLLDDPLAGLDLQFRKTVLEAILAWSEEAQATVIWTSHHGEDGGAVPVDLLLTIEGGRIDAQG